MLPIANFLCLTALGLLVAGCTTQATTHCTMVPVSGSVTVDGQPCAGVKVLFVPMRLNDQCCAYLPFSWAVTNDQGSFVLKSEDGQTLGAVAGEHWVWIRSRQTETHDRPPRPPDASEPPKSDVASRSEEVPARYHLTTELTYVVPPEGTSEARFDLQSE